MSQRSVALIDEQNCIGCAICIEVCPFDAIIGAQNFSHRINYDECPGCKICVDKCPTDCIKVVEINQSKNDIKEKVKYNFDRRKIRKEGLQKKYEESIKEQLDKISNNYK
jgi:RnfABCDGE-type electron transport complex B subunit